MLDITSGVRVHVDALPIAQNDMGVRHAIERNTPVEQPVAMSARHPPKVAGINPVPPAPAHTVPPSEQSAATVRPAAATGQLADQVPDRSPDGVPDRFSDQISDLTTLRELTERLAGTRSVDRALQELLRAGAALIGARRGLAVLEPADGLGPVSTRGLGLSHADLGHLETIPRHATSYGRDLTEPVCVPDLLADAELDPREREVAVRLGYGASYAVPLAGTHSAAPASTTTTTDAGTGTGASTSEAPDAEGLVPTEQLGTAVWLYDEPTEPMARQRHLLALYTRFAGEHLARLLELERCRARTAALTEELLPSRLPRMPGVQLAGRRRAGTPRASGGPSDGAGATGGVWYDALPLPEGALSLAVGSVGGSGPGAVAASGRLRACLRAYAVMEGEDPVAVLSDLELLLRLTEPARTATALFAYAEPDRRRIVLAGAGHAPPLIIGERRAEFVETSLSAPLGMLTCWEAPSVVLTPAPGETLLLYTEGLLWHTGDAMDRAFSRLRAAAASVPAAALADPGAVADHVLRTLLPEDSAGPRPYDTADTRTGIRTGTGTRADTHAGNDADTGTDILADTRADIGESDDFVLLAVRFD
ncbi:PP2C family protein-serine/threonine phosphatase [Streptomyces paludis]|uniref:PP2C family protein-serine/threonine phosphatase n=1 Tax=Streptomyces paludis TaxID=2282738 RepID=UPI0015F2E2F3|nr:PP2C family protein-serine/threonine phosphatase [Streptomyces paludis]